MLPSWAPSAMASRCPKINQLRGGRGRTAFHTAILCIRRRAGSAADICSQFFGSGGTAKGLPSPVDFSLSPHTFSGCVRTSVVPPGLVPVFHLIPAPRRWAIFATPLRGCFWAVLPTLPARKLILIHAKSGAQPDPVLSAACKAVPSPVDLQHVRRRAGTKKRTASVVAISLNISETRLAYSRIQETRRPGSCSRGAGKPLPPGRGESRWSLPGRG